jgi:hypothetical protein
MPFLHDDRSRPGLRQLPRRFVAAGDPNSLTYLCYAGTFATVLSFDRKVVFPLIASRKPRAAVDSDAISGGELSSP